MFDKFIKKDKKKSVKENRKRQEPVDVAVVTEKVAEPAIAPEAVTVGGVRGAVILRRMRMRK